MLTREQTIVPTTYYATVPGPTAVVSTEVVDSTTITSLCPVTETKTLGGSTYTVTWTSTEVWRLRIPNPFHLSPTNLASDDCDQEANAGCCDDFSSGRHRDDRGC